MNKVKVVLLSFAFSCLVISGFGQSNAIKINILSPIVRTFNVAIEHALNESGSFQVGFFYTGYKADNTKFSGFGITPEYRFYLSETPAPQGVYAAPFVRYQSFKLSEESTNSEGTYSAFGGGLIIGKQWIFKERITLDIFLGPAYYSGSVDVTSGSDTFDTGAFDGFGLRTGLTFGVAF